MSMTSLFRWKGGEQYYGPLTTISGPVPLAKTDFDGTCIFNNRGPYEDGYTQAGDINGDVIVNTADAVLALKIVSGASQLVSPLKVTQTQMAAQTSPMRLSSLIALQSKFFPGPIKTYLCF